jgi:hypothetical protein
MTRDDLAPRIFFDGQVAVTAADTSRQLQTRAYNLSASGLFVCCDEFLSVDSEVQLRFALPDGATIACTATVVRVVREDQLEPAGLALAFGEMDATTQARREGFISGRLRPAEGESIQLSIDGVAVPISVRAQTEWENLIAVDAELPFLSLGRRVELSARSGALAGNGAIRWVSVHVPPQTGTPRLNIGIELMPPAQSHAHCDEEHDPICSPDFVAHAQAADKRLREERKAAAEG